MSTGLRNNPVVDYLHALYYSPHRKDPGDIRAHLAAVEGALLDEQRAKRRRRLTRRIEILHRRLRVAEEFAAYDWEKGEREFHSWVAGRIDEQEVFERWRSSGVPLRVLREARRKAHGAERRPSSRLVERLGGLLRKHRGGL